MRVSLGHAERILNALSRVYHRRGEDRLTRDIRDAEAISGVIGPLVKERDDAREALRRIANGRHAGDCAAIEGEDYCTCAVGIARAAIAKAEGTPCRE